MVRNDSQLSVCIPSWNRPEDVLRAVDSVSRHLDIPIVREVIVLDNGSTPAYRAEWFSSKAPTVRLLRSEGNLGASAGRNVLLNAVRTPFALFLDDDCELVSAGDIAGLLALFENNKCFATITANIWEEKRSRLVLRTPSKFRRRPTASKPFAECFGFIGGSFLADIEKLRSVQGFPADGFFGCEELVASHRLFAHGYQFGRSSEIAVFHRPSPQGRLEPQAYGSAHLALRVTVGIVYFRGLARMSHVFTAVVSSLLQYGGQGARVMSRDTYRRINVSVNAERQFAREVIRLRSLAKARLLGWRLFV